MTQDLNQLKKDKKKSLVKNRPTPVPHPADFTLAPPHPGPPGNPPKQKCLKIIMLKQVTILLEGEAMKCH